MSRAKGDLSQPTRGGIALANKVSFIRFAPESDQTKAAPGSTPPSFSLLTRIKCQRDRRCGVLVWATSLGWAKMGGELGSAQVQLSVARPKWEKRVGGRRVG